MGKLQFKVLFFDLDGTLTDSGEGIINSAQFSLEKMGRPVLSKEELRPFVGPPLRGCFHEMLGIPLEDLDTAIRFYREYYTTKGIFENKVYPGIPQALQKLRDLGKTLCLATSKVEELADTIVTRFELKQYFHLIGGSDYAETLDTKAKVIVNNMKRLGIDDPSQAVMIGDREHDIIGAKIAGIQSIGVRYGYADKGELEKAGADYIVDTVEDLAALFL